MFAILFKQQCCTVRAVAFGCFVTFVTENDGDRRLIKTMAPLMSQCAFNVTKDSNYRQLAIKVLAAICEKSTAQLKKHYSVSIEFILAAVLHLMTNLTLDPGVWLDEGDIGGENQEPTVEVAADVLGRISCALKGKAMMKPLLFLVNKMRICVDWRERHAALAGFSAILEGCEKQIEPQAEQYVREILPYLQDKVIPALVNAVKDLSCARVSMSAISALDDFMVDGPNEIFFTHFRAIMDAYIQALAAALYRLQTIGKTSYCEKVIFAMGLMAEAIQDRFTEFYDAIVPHLLRILMTCKAEHEKILRGKAMESLAMIGIAVGKEKFHDDWIVVVELFKKEMPTITFEDPLYMYYTDSCARICKVVGKDFASYLPLIMNYALQMAAYKPQIAIVDEDKAKQDDPVWTYRKIGENFYGISSAGLDEKADTCSWLMQYAKNLEEAFLPYVDKVAKLCVNNLQFFFMDTVRCNAAITMPYLLGCVKGQGVAAMRQLWKKFYSALKNLLAREDEVEVIESIFDAFQESVPFLGADGLAKGEAAEIVALFSHQLRQHEKRRLGYDAERGDEDHDGSKEFRKEMEMEVLARISELLHNLFEVFGEWLFEHVVPAFPNFLQLIDPHRGYQSRQYGVCYINDCLEFAPKKCAKYQNQFVPVMLKCLSDPMPEVRQAAAYGFGVMGELGGPEYQSAVSSALQPLANVTLRADAMASEECADATGNAILAISKILKFFEKHVKLHKSLIEGSEEYKFFKALLHDHQIENMTCAMKVPVPLCSREFLG
ncbi:HEAT repeat protein [Ancylostoma ceylanicum]|uniref:HEAT repeat protein n=1 Tax=Ancylostoma ceylanicum TaxID=53326 RepID=A0A0D6LTR3_9BILA|nr:HEAT repeat protein [Ancylostoma ceylanicum]